MIEAAVFAALDARLDPRSTDPLAVAVSGGGDSMALMRLAAAWAARHGRRLQVLTVDHGLNPDSARWAAFVCEAAGRHRLKARVLRWDGPKPTSGLPAAARAARHALLADAARASGARVLLMGHTADDRLEAERMRAWGSTVGDPHAWSPSPAWPEGRGVFLLRPLLGLRRDALRTWLGAQGEPWIDDPTNVDQRFARARARAASAFADEGPAPAAQDRSRKAPQVTATAKSAAGVLILSRWEPLDRLGPALTSASGGPRVPDTPALERLRARLSSGEDFTSTLSGARIEAVGERIEVGREPGRNGIAPLQAAPGIHVWDGRFEIETDEEGLLVPLCGRLAKLPAVERNALQKLPPWQRPTLPALETAAGLRTVRKRCLVYERWLAACGAFTRESELPARNRGATPAEGLSVSGIVRSGRR